MIAVRITSHEGLSGLDMFAYDPKGGKCVKAQLMCVHALFFNSRRQEPLFLRALTVVILSWLPQEDLTCYELTTSRETATFVNFIDSVSLAIAELR